MLTLCSLVFVTLQKSSDLLFLRQNLCELACPREDVLLLVYNTFNVLFVCMEFLLKVCVHKKKGKNVNSKCT